MRNAVAAKPESLTVLRTGGNLERLLTVKRRHLELGAERCLRNVERKLIVDVVALPGEHHVLLYVENDVQIAWRATLGTDLPFTGQTNLLPAVDARGNLNIQRLGAANSSLATTIGAGRSHDLSLTLTRLAHDHGDELAKHRLLDTS